MRTLYGLVIVMPLLLSACVHEVIPQIPQEIASADYGKVPPNYKEAIQGLMYDQLFDPYSAVYRFFGEPVKGYAHVRGNINPPEFGYLVTVGINAKNRMGAYVGEKLYVFLFKNDTFWKLESYTFTQVVKDVPGHEITPDQPRGQSGTDGLTPSKPGVVLGVNLLPVNSSQALIFKLGEPRGLFIVIVQPNSIAARIGIQVGDIILKYGDKVVNAPSDLQGALASTSPGTTVPITIWRRGNEIILSATF